MSKGKDKGRVKTKATVRSYMAFDRLSLGFEDFLSLMNDVESEFSNLPYYPPFNIKKTDSKTYLLEMYIPGYEKEQVKVSQDGEFLIVSSSDKEIKEDELDDEYIYQGIYPGGAFKCKFIISHKLAVDKAELVEGVLKVWFTDKSAVLPKFEIPVGPFSSGEVKPYQVVYDSSGSPIDPYAAVKAAEKAKEEATEEAVVEPTIIVNKGSATEPTVEVVLPETETIPQIVQVSLESVNKEVSKVSEEPQAVIVVEPATYEIVEDDVHTEILKTEKGKVDVVIAVPTDVKEKLEEKGIDVVADVKIALEETPIEYTDVPKVEVVEEVVAETVTVPDAIPQVVEAVVTEVVTEYDTNGSPVSVEAPEIKLVDVSENVPEDATLIPVVTADGYSDIVVAVTEKSQEILDRAEVDVKEVVEEAVVTVEPAIVEAEAVPVEVVAVEEVVEESIPDVVVLHANDKTTPTTEVVVPEVLPQIVEVTLENVEGRITKKSEEPQATLVVSDASVEVSDNTELFTVKTEKGKADIVVAVDSEVKEKLDSKGIDVVADVTEAITQLIESETATQEAPELPAAESSKVTEVEVSEEVTVEVPVTIPQVVEATVDSDGTVILVDSSESISEEATLVPVITVEGQPDIVVAVTPETEEKLEATAEEVAALVETAVIKAEAEVTPSDSVEVIVPEEPYVAVEENVVTTHTANTEIPTVEITMPETEVLPQIVEVKAVEVAEEVDTTSNEPQVKLEVVDASYEVSDNVELTVVKTEEGKADIVVAVDPELKLELEEKGVDVVAEVATAIEAVEAPNPEVVVELPTEVVVGEVQKSEDETLVVEAPAVVPQVVQLEVSESGEVTKVTLTDASENVPEDTSLFPVVTIEGQNDIVVAIKNEDKEVLETANVTMEDISEAVIAAEVEVKETSKTE